MPAPKNWTTLDVKSDFYYKVMNMKDASTELERARKDASAAEKALSAATAANAPRLLNASGRTAHAAAEAARCTDARLAVALGAFDLAFGAAADARHALRREAGATTVGEYARPQQQRGGETSH